MIIFPLAKDSSELAEACLCHFAYFSLMLLGGYQSKQGGPYYHKNLCVRFGRRKGGEGLNLDGGA